MKLTIYTVALALAATVGFAQDTTPPAQPKQPAQTEAGKTAPAAEAQTPPAAAAQMPAKTGASDRLNEMKTQSYSGTLVDASCGGSGSSAPATAASSTAPAAAPAPSSAGASGQNCAVSASTSQFGLKMKDGNTVRFDDVGNSRVQEAMKARKKWSESAAASKEIRVKVSGVKNGDTLTVMSVN